MMIQKYIMRNSLLIILIAILLNSCEYSVTTAHIENITTCVTMEGEICKSSVSIFSPLDKIIYVSCELKNAPQNTLVTFIWKYTDGKDPIIIDKITLNSSDIGINVDLSSSLSIPYNGWPIGKYEIDISIDGQNNNPIVKYFEVR